MRVADADGNGLSDGLDFLALQRQYGRSAALLETVSTVPEPMTIFGLLFGIAIYLGQRWPRR